MQYQQFNYTTGKQSGNTSGFPYRAKVWLHPKDSNISKGSFFCQKSSSSLLHQTKASCRGLQTIFTTYGYWMKKGCDLQTPEGTNIKWVYGTFITLNSTLSTSVGRNSPDYCNIWKMDIQQKSEKQMLLYPQIFYHRYKYFKQFLLKVVVLFLYSVSKVFLNYRKKIFFIAYK